MSKDRIPGITSKIRQAALKKVEHKEIHLYVEYMTEDEIYNAGPTGLLEKYAEMYPKPGAGVREWTTFQNGLDTDLKQGGKEWNEWVARVIGLATKAFEIHGPMQKSLAWY